MHAHINNMARWDKSVFCGRFHFCVSSSKEINILHWGKQRLKSKLTPNFQWCCIFLGVLPWQLWTALNYAYNKLHREETCYCLMSDRTPSTKCILAGLFPISLVSSTFYYLYLYLYLAIKFKLQQEMWQVWTWLEKVCKPLCNWLFFCIDWIQIVVGSSKKKHVFKLITQLLSLFNPSLPAGTSNKRSQ